MRINLSIKAERTNFKFKMCILRWYVKAEKNDIRIIKRGGQGQKRAMRSFPWGYVK